MAVQSQPTQTPQNWQQWWDELVKRTNTTPPPQFNMPTQAQTQNPTMWSGVQSQPQQSQQTSFPTYNTPDSLYQPTVPRGTPWTPVTYPVPTQIKQTKVGGLKTQYTSTTSTATPTPVTPTPSTTFDGDDYDAQAVIAFARPDIFQGIGYNTGWDKANQRGINGWNASSGTVTADDRNWAAFSGPDKGDPLYIQRVVEEWAHMGGAPGANDPSTTPYKGDYQQIAAQLYSKLTPEQQANAKVLASQLKAMDYLVYKLTDGGQWNQFADWANNFGKEKWNGNFDTIENARKSVVAWVKTQAFQQANVDPNYVPPWGDQNYDIVHIAQKYGWNGTDTPQQIGGLYKKSDDYNPISSNLWFNFGGKGATIQPWMTSYGQSGYMKTKATAPTITVSTTT
jgi:hypothetical protein